MKYRFQRTPRAWQLRAFRLLLLHNGGAIFAPMRSGKSKVAIDWVAAKVLKDGVERVLIVAPLSAFAGWRDSIHRDLSPAVAERVEIRLVNFERTYGREPDGAGGWYAVDNDELEQFDPQVAIIDESHRVGDPSTLANKKLYKLLRTRDTPVVLLTGTPFHRKPIMIFGQWKLRDDAVFGTHFGAFKKTYVRYGGYGGYEILGYRKLKRMRKKIAPETFFMAHVPPREPVEVHIKFPLEESRSVYETMATDGFVSLGKKDTVDASNPLVRHLRLSQIVGGQVRTDRGKRRAVGGEKARAFDDLVRQLQDSEVPKFVVGVRFIFELVSAARVAKAHGYHVLLYHGGLSERQREKRLTLAHETDKPIAFISQMAAGSLGVDLSFADTMVLWSLTRSLVDFDQFKARIRLYQDTRPLTYYYLMGEGTVDEINLLALKQGYDVVEFLVNHPDLLKYREVA